MEFVKVNCLTVTGPNKMYNQDEVVPTSAFSPVGLANLLKMGKVVKCDKKGKVIEEPTKEEIADELTSLREAYMELSSVEPNPRWKAPKLREEIAKLKK